MLQLYRHAASDIAAGRSVAYRIVSQFDLSCTEYVTLLSMGADDTLPLCWGVHDHHIVEAA